MRSSSLKISDAFEVLGLEEGASLEVVKTAYKQVALRTHPDKNPDNPSATEEFQRVGEAYRVLVKHLDQSSKPSAGPRGFYNFSNDSYSDDEYEDYEYGSDIDDDLLFYKWIFEEMMRNRSYFARRGAYFGRPKYQAQTTEQYQEQLRRSREEQLAAQERRKQEEIARKERAAEEREQERLEAERRQRDKAEKKKAQAEAARKSAEERANALLRKTQEKRSAVFAAARRGESDKVRKGIWEDAVDAAGGEIRPGCAKFVKSPPQDLQETLLHIATKRGDLDLVVWLDTHNADVEERNSLGLTTFHIALKEGRTSIINYFIETYPPKDSDTRRIYSCVEGSNLLFMAIESGEPELVWIVLDKKMASCQDINQALGHATSKINPKGAKSDNERREDIVKLLMRYGGLSRPRPTVKTNGQPSPQRSPSGTNPKPLQSPISSSGTSPNNGKGTPSPVKQNSYRGRGRGRGRGRPSSYSHAH